MPPPWHCEKLPLDSEELAAGDLYGFEYKEGSTELVSMKTEAGVPVPILGEKGTNSLRDQGEVPKEALLNPRGLAVDPVTGNVVITGDEDRQENSKVEKEEGEKECRGAAQLVTIEETHAKTIKASLGTTSGGAARTLRRWNTKPSRPRRSSHPAAECSPR